MGIESSENSNKKSFSKSLKMKEENIVCKDGFCSITNREGISPLEQDETPLFDPI